VKRWTIYTRDGHLETAPREVECEAGGYPCKDADGRTQYENSHFDDEDKAWEELIANANAGVRLAASDVRERRARLAEAEKHLVDDALLADAIRLAHEQRQRERA
jgi:hypothetical protein